MLRILAPVFFLFYICLFFLQMFYYFRKLLYRKAEWVGKESLKRREKRAFSMEDVCINQRTAFMFEWKERKLSIVSCIHIHTQRRSRPYIHFNIKCPIGAIKHWDALGEGRYSAIRELRFSSPPFCTATITPETHAQCGIYGFMDVLWLKGTTLIRSFLISS